MLAIMLRRSTQSPSFWHSRTWAQSIDLMCTAFSRRRSQAVYERAAHIVRSQCVKWVWFVCVVLCARASIVIDAEIFFFNLIFHVCKSALEWRRKRKWFYFTRTHLSLSRQKQFRLPLSSAECVFWFLIRSAHPRFYNFIHFSDRSSFSRSLWLWWIQKQFRIKIAGTALQFYCFFFFLLFYSFSYPMEWAVSTGGGSQNKWREWRWIQRVDAACKCCTMSDVCKWH